MILIKRCATEYRMDMCGHLNRSKHVVLPPEVDVRLEFEKCVVGSNTFNLLYDNISNAMHNKESPAPQLRLMILSVVDDEKQYKSGW